MNAALQKTIFYLTGKPNLAQVSTEELESLLISYPYFAPLQVAYAAKLNTIDTHKANIQLQKTGLYCTNQKWLQYQLMDASNFEVHLSNSIVPNFEIPTIEDVKQIMDGVDKNETATDFASSTENTLPQQTAIVTEQNITSYSLEKPRVIEQIQEIAEVPQPEEKLSPNTFILDIHTTASSKSVVEIAEEKNVPIDEPKVEAPIEANIVAEASPTVENIVMEEETKQVDDSSQYLPTIEDEIISSPIDNQIESPLPSKDIHAQIAKLKEEWQKPVEKETSNFEFDVEPYYTIDYFAAQGIKFDISKEPKDVLTKKMLRFTDWLKRMKSANQIIEENDEDDAQDIEAAILKIANVSNQPKEIVTETMAQVFEKQGKINKAVQLYIKLSFLNPDKTAYFATKIQELKGIKS